MTTFPEDDFSEPLNGSGVTNPVPPTGTNDDNFSDDIDDGNGADVPVENRFAELQRRYKAQQAKLDSIENRLASISQMPQNIQQPASQADNAEQRKKLFEQKALELGYVDENGDPDVQALERQAKTFMELSGAIFQPMVDKLQDKTDELDLMAEDQTYRNYKAHVEQLMNTHPHFKSLKGKIPNKDIRAMALEHAKLQAQVSNPGTQQRFQRPSVGSSTTPVPQTKVKLDEYDEEILRENPTIDRKKYMQIKAGL